MLRHEEPNQGVARDKFWWKRHQKSDLRMSDEGVLGREDRGAWSLKQEQFCRRHLT